jgi:3-oxoacyl-[acyl-carrier-protein] synthase II
MGAAVVAWGAASALGVGRVAFDVGQAGQAPRSAWSQRSGGKLFGRVTACSAERAARPAALLELGLTQLTAELDQRLPAWRGQRLGVIVGTSSGGLSALERAVSDGANTWERAAYFSPLRVVEPVLGRAPTRLVSLYAACASSAMAIGLGLRWLELGELELVIAGGYDAESDWVCAGFDALKATSAGHPRPFRAERDGMALGEGVALLALSSVAARPFGFVTGFGATTDAVHVTAPDRTGSSLARAAELALGDAELPAAAVDFVSAHGTGTAFNDAAEAAALGLVLGPAQADKTLHAFKPQVGHTLGAAGALETLAALSALENGVLPASAGTGADMPELGLRLLERNVAAPAEHCLKLATAFGGANAALVLARSRPRPKSRAARAVYVARIGVPCSELDPERVAPLLVAPPSRLPRSDLLSLLAIAASAEVLRGVAGFERSRTGVVVGSARASIQASSEFGARIVKRGPEHAEPRRFPDTSPNVCAGHVAIAFGLGGPSHAVGSGGRAGFEALEVARDWLAAGDADTMLVVAAEHAAESARPVVEAAGLRPAPSGAVGLWLTLAPEGLRLGELGPVAGEGVYGLVDWARRVGLPGAEAFGSVPRPE